MALLADCVARLISAYTLPVSTMVWLGTVLILGTIVLACLVSGVASAPMDAMIGAQAAAGQPAAREPAGRGGMGWAIIEKDADPPRLDGDYVRDKAEQVRYLTELNEIFAAEGVDLGLLVHLHRVRTGVRPRPAGDLDLASYGVVKMLPGDPPAGYQGLGWEPKLAFRALADLS